MTRRELEGSDVACSSLVVRGDLTVQGNVITPAQITIYPEVRIVDPGGGNRPTIATGGATFGWLFAVADEMWFEFPFEPGLDRTQDVTVYASWAPTGNEVGKLVSWQLDVLPISPGDQVIAGGTAIQAVDDAVPDTAGIYTSSVFVIPAAMLGTKLECHCHLTRIASSADPVAPPGIHHIAVAQTLASV